MLGVEIDVFKNLLLQFSDLVGFSESFGIQRKAAHHSKSAGWLFIKDTHREYAR